MSVLVLPDHALLNTEALQLDPLSGINFPGVGSQRFEVSYLEGQRIYFGLTEFTMLGWFRFTDQSGGIVSILRCDGICTALQINGNTPRVALWNSAGTLSLCTFTGVNAYSTGGTGIWKSYAVRWKQGVNSNIPQLSLNGASWVNASAGFTGPIRNTISGTKPFCVGSNELSAESFIGDIGEIAFFDRYMDTNECQALLQQGPWAAERSLRFYIRGDDNNGLRDLSPRQLTLIPSVSNKYTLADQDAPVMRLSPRISYWKQITNNIKRYRARSSVIG